MRDAHPVPVTPKELVLSLRQKGFAAVSEDIEAMLKELAEAGEVIGIDEDAGYRWNPGGGLEAT